MDLVGKILKYQKPVIHISSKKDMISLFADRIILNENRLTNWKTIAHLLKRVTAEEATRMFESCKRGTEKDSTDFNGQFFREIRNITEIKGKAPRQVKMKF